MSRRIRNARQHDEKNGEHDPFVWNEAAQFCQHKIREEQSQKRGAELKESHQNQNSGEDGVRETGGFRHSLQVCVPEVSCPVSSSSCSDGIV